MGPGLHRWLGALMAAAAACGPEHTAQTVAADPCDDAQLVDLGDTGFSQTGALAAATDVHAVAFTAQEGVFYRITAAGDGGADALDGVVSLYDASGERIAVVDDAPAWASTDPLLIWRAPRSGRFCATLTSYEGWSQLAWKHQTDLRYTLTIAPETTYGTVLDRSDSDSPRSAPEVALDGTPLSASMAGVAGEQTDYFRIGPVDAPGVLSVWSLVWTGSGWPSHGVFGSGSSATVTVGIEADGDVVSERSVNGGNGVAARVAPDASYVVSVDRAAGTAAGDNDFYALLAVFTPLTDLVFEPLGDNDSVQTAGQVPFTGDVAEFFGTWGGAGDRDVFALFDAPHRVDVACGARALGIAGDPLQLVLRDCAGEEVARGEEGDTDPARASEQACYAEIVPGQPDVAAGSLYRCVVLRN